MSHTTEEAIKSHLRDIAEERDLTVLAAREYGSRARGFPDSESDYDVLFVYVQPAANYAVGPYKDTIDVDIPAEDSRANREIEFKGWNLKKFIGGDGLGGSNPSALDFVMAGEENEYMFYLMTEKPFRSILTHVEWTFKPYALMNHYRSMAAAQYGKYIEDGYKLAGDVGYEDLLQYADIKWENLATSLSSRVDEERTTIGDDHIEVRGEAFSTFVDDIDMERAVELGLVEKTTTEPTVRRHLHAVRSLMNSRLVEETHTLPPIDYNDTLRMVADEDWLPEEVYAECGRLVAVKREGKGDETTSTPVVYDWIESELERDIDPEPHVQRTPSKEYIRNQARYIVEEVFSDDR